MRITRLVTSIMLAVSLSVVSITAANAMSVQESKRKQQQISLHDRKKFCRYQSIDNGKWTDHEVDLTIQCAVNHWPVSGGFSYAHQISERESGDSWFAKNPSSGTCGIYQHQPSLWPGRVQYANNQIPRWNLGSDCLNARSNIIVSIRMAHSGGWSPWGGPSAVSTLSVAANGADSSVAISSATSVIGTQYVWGSADPNVGFDCSGLVLWAYAHAGVVLPHSSAMMAAMLPHVSLGDLVPGDLVFFYSPVSHVGIYIGNGQMIDAAHSGPGGEVDIRSIDTGSFVYGGRIA